MDVKVNLEEAKKLLSVPESCLRRVEGELTVLVHPMHSSNIKEGVLEELKALIKRYSKELQGIPMAYEKIQLVSCNGWLFDTNPFNHVVVRAMFYVFTPQIGSILEATVKKKSINHVGCLVHGMFNVSVPRPQDEVVENWCGTYVQEGDVVKITITDLNITTYIPYIKGELDPDRVQELVDARREEEEQKAQDNKKITFDDDSGISSNDHEESVVPQVKKKNKKNKSSSDSDDQNNTVMDDSEDETGEKDGTDESQKKKKKRNQEDGEASNIDLINVVEKKKKKKKKNHQESDDEVNPEENDILDSLLNESIHSNSNDTPKRKKKKRDKSEEEEATKTLSDSETKETKKRKKKHKKRIALSDIEGEVKDTEDNDFTDVPGNLLNERMISDCNTTPKRKKKRELEDEEVSITVLNSDPKTKEEKKKHKKNKHRAVERREENEEVNLDEMLDDLKKEVSPSKPSGKTPDAMKPTKSRKRKADEDLDSSRGNKRKKL